MPMVRNPLNGTFELTARCNLSCKMCYVRIDDNIICLLGARERAAEEWIDMASQAAEEYIKNGPINIKDKPTNIEEKPLGERIKKEAASETYYGCKAGINEYHITWDGKLLPYSIMGKNYTLPFDIGFGKAWEGLAKAIIVPKYPEQCQSCKYINYCFSCAANRYCETGSEEGVPDYICQEAKALYKILN